MVKYSLYDVLFYLFLYGFLGWVVEVCYYSIRDRRFVNRGFVSLPLHIPCGISFALLILVLPSLGRNFPLQFIAAAMIRYNTRAARPEPNGAVEAFLDSQYGDAYVEHRWPNMIVTEK